ncbi:hypothetical protein Gohar_000791 [Gossypium harknessii]|uniref:Uncharacterized protein n=1 Tax=Gossypium harknessii TaxID=34285 RepID=A0A7J9I3C4_9ROSI|nr:hypothetical protein [Gossypium harknessii]
MVVVDGGVLARENGFPGLRSVGGHVTKKVRLREDESPNEGEADVLKETVRGLPTIKFSKRVYELVHQSMMRTVVLKLLGRSIRSLYKKSLLNEIGMIGNVTNIDYNIDNGTQGWFARMVVCVDLNDVEEVDKVPIKEPSMEYKVAMKDYGSWMVV